MCFDLEFSIKKKTHTFTINSVSTFNLRKTKYSTVTQKLMQLTLVRYSCVFSYKCKRFVQKK